jgi:hypothetical protein
MRARHTGGGCIGDRLPRNPPKPGLHAHGPAYGGRPRGKPTGPAVAKAHRYDRTGDLVAPASAESPTFQPHNPSPSPGNWPAAMDKAQCPAQAGTAAAPGPHR